MPLPFSLGRKGLATLTKCAFSARVYCLGSRSAQRHSDILSLSAPTSTLGRRWESISNQGGSISRRCRGLDSFVCVRQGIDLPPNSRWQLLSRLGGREVHSMHQIFEAGVRAQTIRRDWSSSGGPLLPAFPRHLLNQPASSRV